MSPRLVARGERGQVIGCLAILLPVASPRSTKQFAQSLASFVQLRLRIPDRASKNLGNLVVFVTLDVVQNKYFPVAFRQLIDRPLEVNAVEQTTQPRVRPADFIARPVIAFVPSADFIE